MMIVMTETANSTAYTQRADALALWDIAPYGRNFVYPQTLYAIVRKANGLSHIDVEMYRLRNINYWRKKMYKYAIEIFYSDEDEGYIAVVPELADCSAFGESEEAALREIMTAMELWLETAEKDGREIPQPGGKELLRAIVDEKIAIRPTHPQGAGV